MTVSAVPEISLVPGVESFLMSPKKLLVDGAWVDSESGMTFATCNPANGKVLAHVADIQSLYRDEVCVPCTGQRC